MSGPLLKILKAAKQDYLSGYSSTESFELGYF